MAQQAAKQQLHQGQDLWNVSWTTRAACQGHCVSENKIQQASQALLSCSSSWKTNSSTWQEKKYAIVFLMTNHAAPTKFMNIDTIPKTSLQKVKRQHPPTAKSGEFEPHHITNTQRSPTSHKDQAEKRNKQQWNPWKQDMLGKFDDQCERGNNLNSHLAFPSAVLAGHVAAVCLLTHWKNPSSPLTAYSDRSASAACAHHSISTSSPALNYITSPPTACPLVDWEHE